MSRALPTIRVRLGSRSYPVRVSTVGATLVAGVLARLGAGCVVVTDVNVRRHVWPRIAAALRRSGFPLEPLVVPAGERSKDLRMLGWLEAAMLRRGLDRTGCVVAVGGGVVLDLAGFAAATYMRGVPWVAVPTTLLAMVDAAVGGKVGVDLAGIKNVVGAFHQPRAVLVGTDFLSTLPARERRSGLAEVVKYGMIADRALFDALERSSRSLLLPDASRDAALVARCCRIKARIVADDERESGRRAMLNFGHTIGHALEGDGQSGLLHGEAVGLGMIVACALAEETGVAREPLLQRLGPLLARLRLPIVAPAPIALERLRRRWRRDKKAARGQPNFVLTPRIGAASVDYHIPELRVVQALRAIFEPRRERARDRIRRRALQRRVAPR